MGRIHQKLLKWAGIEHIRFHDLRYTYTTLAPQNGVDIKTLSGILGHYPFRLHKGLFKQSLCICDESDAAECGRQDGKVHVRLYPVIPENIR